MFGIRLEDPDSSAFADSAGVDPSVIPETSTDDKREGILPEAMGRGFCGMFCWTPPIDSQWEVSRRGIGTFGSFSF